MHHISELVQLVIRRERWGVRTNGEPCTLITAAMPPALSVKGKFTDAHGKETKPTIGFLMADAYAGYNRACGPGRYDRQACLAHGQRKFELYEKLDRNAADIMTMNNGLHRIEREAKRESARLKLNHDETAAIYFTARQTHSVPLLAKLKLRLIALVDVYAPSEGLGKAVAYFLKRWDDFTRYTSSGYLPIGNNAAESSIRAIVIGRKKLVLRRQQRRRRLSRHHAHPHQKLPPPKHRPLRLPPPRRRIIAPRAQRRSRHTDPTRTGTAAENSLSGPAEQKIRR